MTLQQTSSATTVVRRSAARSVPASPAPPSGRVDSAGHHIPADTLVATAPAVNHFDDTVWTGPDAFVRDRFTAARADDRAHRFAGIPFGGGAHKCIGLHSGTLEVTAILHELLGTHTWSIDDRYTVRCDTSLPVPIDELPLTLSRRPDVPHSRAIQFA